MSIKQIQALTEHVEKVIVGKTRVIRLTIAALLGRGHILIEDVPGVGKTTLAHCLARSIDGSFQRIQFTNDMLPSDILGVSVYDAKTGEFHFRPGPIFANIILADEINRTTPKTQSSLLEAMNEMQISVDSKTYPLPRPFLILATQNPVEHHGTFPLPESQMDRFIIRIRIGYPDTKDERRILMGRNPALRVAEYEPILHGDDISTLQDEVEKVRIDDTLVDYVLAIVQSTRESASIELGISPRGSLAFLTMARAWAFVQGRDYCVPDDFKEMALPTLAHRLVLRHSASLVKSGPASAEDVLQEILDTVPIPS